MLDECALPLDVAQQGSAALGAENTITGQPSKVREHALAGFTEKNTCRIAGVPGAVSGFLPGGNGSGRIGPGCGKISVQ